MTEEDFDFAQIVKRTMLELLEKYREINPDASAISAYAHDLGDVACYSIQVIGGEKHEKNDFLYNASYEPKAEAQV